MNDYQSLINWYPGHMAKARRLLLDQIKRVDLIIEVCDARLPLSSRNPDLIRMTANKQHLLYLNKADLADPAMTDQWVQYFRLTGIDTYQSCSLSMRSKETLASIERATKALVGKAQEKGVRKTVRAMIVGIPNAGKSTFINRLNGRGIAKAEDRPGVTRSNQWVKISPYLELLDTPGLLWPKMENQDAARKLCYIGSFKDDVIDLYDLVIHLLEDLCRMMPVQTMDRFHFQNPYLKGTELLDAVCAGRGWLLKGRLFDYDRCVSIVLDEFRAGKLGRITLETPPYQNAEVHYGKD